MQALQNYDYDLKEVYKIFKKYNLKSEPMAYLNKLMGNLDDAFDNY